MNDFILPWQLFGSFWGLPLRQCMRANEAIKDLELEARHQTPPGGWVGQSYLSSPGSCYLGRKIILASLWGLL